jgi:putative SOS response-associated peptidase YedK
MCGRYNVIPNAAAFLDAFDISIGLEHLPEAPAYNISPSKGKRITRVPIVRMRANQRELVLVRWPLIPSWAKGQPVSYSTANAKSETMDSKPTYRRAWQCQRCLIPANGYYEWQVVPQQKHKQPHHIRMADREMFAFGGLWEASVTEQGDAIESCAIVTTAANTVLEHIHSRMPLIIPREGYRDWLSGTTDEAAHWIRPCPAALLETYPVSTYVNNPANDNPRCIEPLTSKRAAAGGTPTQHES